MSDSSDNRQKWLGIATLLVCIGILWALLFPNLHRRRSEFSRRAQCLNNLKNLSIATANFEGTKRQYPGYQSLFGADSTRKAKIGTWVVSLMPFLPWEASQQQNSRDQWDDPSTYDAMALNFLLCHQISCRRLNMPARPMLRTPDSTYCQTILRLGWKRTLNPKMRRKGQSFRNEPPAIKYQDKNLLSRRFNPQI